MHKRYYFPLIFFIYLKYKNNLNKLRGFSPQVNYTDRGTAAGRS
jgi:hypothetical protein